MKCPGCQSENPEDAKFCIDCGAPMELPCPSCGAPTPAKGRFCKECGHVLTPSTEAARKDLSFDEKIAKIQRYLPEGLTEKILSQRDRIEGERKQVTVMFCDMEGFTALTERLGPEEAYAIMDQVYEILIHKVLGMSACGSDDTDDPGGECPVIVTDVDCDTSKRPFVFVHGSFGSGGNMANVAMLFGSNGYCQDRFLAVEYNSLGGNPIAPLDALIDKVLTDENLGRSDSVVGLFMYDGNTNGDSELGSLFAAPFVVGTDVFMDASSPAWVELEWNDPTNESGTTTMRIPNWPSSEALTLVYF